MQLFITGAFAGSAATTLLFWVIAAAYRAGQKKGAGE